MKIHFQPSTRQEALYWCLFHPDYSLAEAWRMKSLTLRKNDIVSVQAASSENPKWTIEIKNEKVEGSFPCRNLPVALESSATSTGPGDAKSFFRQLSASLGKIILQFYRYSPILSYMATSVLLFWGTLAAKSLWLSRHDPTVGCDRACATGILSVWMTSILIILLCISSVAIPFYFVRSAQKIKNGNDRTAVQVEAWILLIVGLVVTLQALPFYLKPQTLSQMRQLQARFSGKPQAPRSQERVPTSQP